jgi:hypothetical protein
MSRNYKIPRIQRNYLNPLKRFGGRNTVRQELITPQPADDCVHLL